MGEFTQVNTMLVTQHVGGGIFSLPSDTSLTNILLTNDEKMAKAITKKIVAASESKE